MILIDGKSQDNFSDNKNAEGNASVYGVASAIESRSSFLTWTKRTEWRFSVLEFLYETAFLFFRGDSPIS